MGKSLDCGEQGPSAPELTAGLLAGYKPGREMTNRGVHQEVGSKRRRSPMRFGRRREIWQGTNIPLVRVA